MRRVWEWLNGKKTVIGAIILIVYGIPHVEEMVGPKGMDVIYYIGSVFASGGVLHKALKPRRDQ